MLCNQLKAVLKLVQERRQRKMSGGGDKTKNLKPMVIISVVCGIRNAAYFFYAE